MNLIDRLNNRLGWRRADDQPKPGYEHFGGEPADPRNSRYWRSIPHPSRIAIPTMGDYNIETASRVRAHEAGIDDATGPFLHPLIDAEAEAIGVAIEERYLDQVRTEQGLWADEDTLAYRHQLNAEILKTQLEIADADYRAGKDALLGEPGATPAWNEAITGTRHTPALPVPGMAAARLPAPATTPADDADAAPAAPGQAPETKTQPSAPEPHRESHGTSSPTRENHPTDGAEEPDELDEEAA